MLFHFPDEGPLDHTRPISSGWLIPLLAIKESLLLLQIDFFNKPRPEYLFSEEGTVFNENAEY